jgi:hypothetical protein
MMASRCGASRRSTGSAPARAAGESVPRFGALDRNFPGGAARRRLRAKIFLGAENRPVAALAGHREVAADRCAALRAHARRIGAHLENPCATRLFVARRNLRARATRAPVRAIVAAGARENARRGDDGGRSRHPRFVKRSRCFSHCAVVIGVQCMSIRDCTVPKSPSLMARRAVWRREPNRRRSPRRRRLRRRRSAKPRAERSSLRRVHAVGLQAGSRGVASVGGLPCQHAQRCCGTRRQSRRRGASATSKFDLHGAWIWGSALVVGSSNMSSTPSASCRGRSLCRRSIRPICRRVAARHTEHRYPFCIRGSAARSRRCWSPSFRSTPSCRALPRSEPERGGRRR